MSSNSSDRKIGGVMVLYNPDWEVTHNAIQSLVEQLDHLVLVDNSINICNSEMIKDYKNLTYIALGENRGIAAAQNIGIRFLLDSAFEFVLFSDQDSIIPKNLINALFEGYNQLNRKKIKIAAIGTRAINKITCLPYPSKSKELGRPLEMAGEEYECNITECYSVRSSVSIIPMNSLKEVGVFDESLFIDGVDHEWCWRAWHKSGLRSFIIENAVIYHMLGEGDRSIGCKKVAISSAFRVYYQFRNFLWLSRRTSTPKYWISENRKKYLIKAFYYPLMISPRLKYLKNIYRGIKDGLKKDGEFRIDL